VTETAPSGPATDVQQLRAERDELRRRLDAAERNARPPRRTRRVAAACLVVVTALVFGAAVAATWVRVNTVRTDKFVDLVGPLGSDPDVQAALADFTTAQLVSAIDARAYLADALPDRATVLAVPLASAVNGYVGDRVDEFFTSDRFERLWENAVRLAHEGMLAVLEGDAENVRVENGDVVLNLVPLYNAVLTRVEEGAAGILGRNVNLPDIEPGMLPDDARQRIEDAIGRDLPDNWGTIVVFEEQRLTAMQDALQLFRRATALLAIVAVALVGLTLWVSPNRRRTGLQLAVGIAVVLVLLRRVTFTAQDSVIDAVKVEQNQRAVSNITDHVLSGFYGLTAVLLWACFAIALVLFLAGPSRLAVAIRSGAAGAARTVAGAGATTAERAASSAWVRAHREALQVGVAVVMVLFVLAVRLTFWQLLVVVVVTAVVEWLLWRLVADEPPPAPGDEAHAAPV
jgi:hypothetical protein